jgi:hypothetical protein
MPTISRKALSDAVKARAATITNCVVYLGEPTNVPNTSGFTVPHIALYPGTGTPSVEQDIADTAVDLDWLLQITVAGGYVDDVLALATRVDAAFYRWTPTVTGLVCGPLKPPAGYDPGPVRFDRDVTPHRPFLPLQYTTRITAT